jgi:hypothetical protein
LKLIIFVVVFVPSGYAAVCLHTNAVCKSFLHSTLNAAGTALFPAAARVVAAPIITTSSDRGWSPCGKGKGKAELMTQIPLRAT